MGNSGTTYWLIYVGMRRALGLWRSKALRHAYIHWLAKNGWPNICALCGEKISHKDRSIDHIIPMNICFEIERPQLIFDERNFRVTHKLCNSKRHSDVSDLPEKVVAKLLELGYSPK